MTRQQLQARPRWRAPIWTLALGAALTWSGPGAADPSCKINPKNPTVSTGDSISWSARVNDIRRYASHDWDLGGGSPTSSDRRRPTVRYDQPGTFETRLVVSDRRRQTECTTTITVNGAANTPPTADAGPSVSGTVGVAVAFDGSGSSNADGEIASYSWDFGDGSAEAGSGSTPSHVYTAGGSYTVTLTVTDDQGATDTDTTTAVIGDGGGEPAPAVSINSTSTNSFEAGVDPFVEGPISEQPRPNDNNSLSPAPGTGTTGYQILSINDLGMHCGDLDSRVAGILPPFQVKLSQVIRKGAEPELLGPDGNDAVEVVYSAASNPSDPILAQGDEAFTGLTAFGDVYKTNFWEVAFRAYDPFYPPGILAAFYDPDNPEQNIDIGLPVPNVEHLYIGADGIVNSGDETLSAVQHAMPGVASPYLANDREVAEEFYEHKPFFVNFPFGYVADDVNWFEAAGIPFAAFDDFGRENPYPLIRVQAKAPGENGAVLATVDTVLPISGEASCMNCHGSTADVDPDDVPTAGVATTALKDAGLPIANSLDDDLSGTLPVAVSVEYATDINILRLHDLKHGDNYVDSDGNATPCAIGDGNGGNGNANCLTNKALDQGASVVCQMCHYTPALDLAQLGPLGGIGGDDDANANGRIQRVNKSNSNVMHHHHGSLNAEPQFAGLFPAMPTPIGDGQDGLPTNHADRQAALEQTCYQCHPGTKTKCLRGAMSDGGMVCQDCHGGMLQVGNDFTAGLSLDTPFLPDGTNADLTKRVPWANEPGCGSCHTGDANDNLADPDDPTVAINAVDSYGNADTIRLIRAFRDAADAETTPSAPDADATPIQPSNTRFAENTVPEFFSQPGDDFANPGAGNPKLYRVSTGHGGVFCEGCHGATHAEWDSDGSPLLNDNVTANQLQGHSGTVTECSTCHGAGWEPDRDDALEGPHGMHVVGDTRFSDGGHEDIAEESAEACFACHGGSSRRDSPGTVLSRAAVARTLSNEGRTVSVAKGEPVGCILCHDGSDD